MAAAHGDSRLMAGWAGWGVWANQQRELGTERVLLLLLTRPSSSCARSHTLSQDHFDL